MDSRQPLHQGNQQQNQPSGFIRSDSSERRQMMEHYAQKGPFSQQQPPQAHQYQAPQAIPQTFMHPQPMYTPQQQQYQQYQQMVMQQYQQYQYQMMLMQQYQQQMAAQNVYPLHHQGEQPSTHQHWPQIPGYQVPQLAQLSQPFQQSPESNLNFKIATGDETNSIFEAAVLGNKYQSGEAMEEWSDDDYGEEEEDDEAEEQVEAMPVDQTLKPQKLPLETILEENSVLHKEKAVELNKKAIEKKVKKKNVPPQEKPQPKQQKEKPEKQPTHEAKPPKLKHKYPEMSENERKLAEADAYLRKLNQKQKQNQQQDLDSDIDRLSAWTGESLINIKHNSAAAQDVTNKHPSQMYKAAALPDKERLLEDILILRQTKNVNEEQIRLLKVSCARLRKHCDKLQDQIYTQVFDSQPDWVKHKEPGHLMQVSDLESAMEEIRRLKRENNQLAEQRQFYKVNQDKYKQRAIFMRKKYTILNAAQNESGGGGKDPDTKLRLKATQYKTQLKQKTGEVESLKRDIGELKIKANHYQQSCVKHRQQLQLSNETQKKLTQKLLKLETNQKKRDKLEELKRHIEETMRQDDALKEQDHELTLQQARSAKKRSDQIDKLEQYGEFVTPTHSDEELILHQSDCSDNDDGDEKGKADTGSAIDKDIVVQTKDYVAATLNAWNNCPGIVKKQLDKQAQEIEELTATVRELNLKLVQRRTDFEREHQAQLKTDLMKHKEKIEAIYKEKLDEEKRKLLKGRVDEMDKLIRENKRLNQQIQSKW